MSKTIPYKSKLGLLCVLVFLLVFSAAYPPVRALAAEGYDKYREPEGAFSIFVPKDWERLETGHPYGDLTKISGVRLIGPTGRDAVPITIAALYYGGEGAFNTPAAFIGSQLNSPVRTDYDRTDVVNDIRVAGKNGKKFQIRTFELVYLPADGFASPPEGRVYEAAPPTKKVPMLRQFIVLPAGKGYLVLSYDAPEETAEKFQGLFDTVAGSLQMHLP